MIENIDKKEICGILETLADDYGQSIASKERLRELAGKLRKG